MNQQKYFNCDKDKRIVQKKIPIILIIAPINTPWIHNRFCLKMTPDHSGV